ncbi:MAG: UrcA family protein [Pseudomonadota bacterium]
MKSLILLTAAISTLAANGPTAAADPETASITAQFSFNRDAPAEEIYREIRALARATCRMDTGYALEFARLKAERECRSEFIDNAVASIRSDDLSSYYTAQTGKTAGRLTIARNSQ